jgi:hypothetical protein
MDVRFIGKRHYGIEENMQVGTTTHPFDGVAGCGIAGVKVRGSGAGQVPTGGEADNSHTLGIETPREGICANITNGALGIIHFGRVMILLPEARFENEGSDAVGGEPLCRREAFARGEMRVSATRHDNHRGPTGFARREKKNGQSRNIDGGIIALLEWRSG